MAKKVIRDEEKKTVFSENTGQSTRDNLSFHNFLSLGKIAVGLIHDLINPVMALRFHLEMLEKNASRYLAEDDWYHLEQSMRITRTMDEYIRIARDTMRTQVSEELFVVVDEIKKTCQLLTNAFLNAKIALFIQCDESMSIYGNRTKFNRMLMNVLTNAIDAYEGDDAPYETHGKITSVERKILVHMERLEQAQDGLAMHVTDYGKGMTNEQAIHLFEPFYSTKKSSAGIGIGLFTVKETIEKDFGGKVFFESVPKVSTTCTLFFPKHVPSVGIEPTSQA